MAFAVIQTGGKQYKVTPGARLEVEKLEREAGSSFSFDDVLMVAPEGGEVKIGMPYVPGAKVEARVVSHGRGEKKIVFRYHSKTRYRKKNTHRQPYTEIEIVSIQ